MLKVRCEDAFPDALTDFIHAPKAPSVKFGRRADFSVIHGLMHKDQFLFTVALKDILSDALGGKVRYAQFFANLTPQSIFDTFSQVYVSAYSRVPFPRLNVLPLWSALQIQFSFLVKHVEVHHGV